MTERQYAIIFGAACGVTGFLIGTTIVAIKYNPSVWNLGAILYLPIMAYIIYTNLPPKE